MGSKSRFRRLIISIRDRRELIEAVDFGEASDSKYRRRRMLHLFRQRLLEAPSLGKWVAFHPLGQIIVSSRITSSTRDKVSSGLVGCDNRWDEEALNPQSAAPTRIKPFIYDAEA